jgi:hypothetical protein
MKLLNTILAMALFVPGLLLANSSDITIKAKCEAGVNEVWTLQLSYKTDTNLVTLHAGLEGWVSDADAPNGGSTFSWDAITDSYSWVKDGTSEFTKVITNDHTGGYFAALDFVFKKTDIYGNVSWDNAGSSMGYYRATFFDLNTSCADFADFKTIKVDSIQK